MITPPEEYTKILQKLLLTCHRVFVKIAYFKHYKMKIPTYGVVTITGILTLLDMTRAVGVVFLKTKTNIPRSELSENSMKTNSVRRGLKRKRIYAIRNENEPLEMGTSFCKKRNLENELSRIGNGIRGRKTNSQKTETEIA